MFYNLHIALDRNRFMKRAMQMCQDEALVELKEKSVRSKSQNAYLHLLLGIVAMETGNTIDYCKEWYYKRLVNPDYFILKVQDKYLGEVERLRSTTQLTKEEMTVTIDRLRKWGAENGMYLPSADEKGLLEEAEIELGRIRQYL